MPFGLNIGLKWVLLGVVGLVVWGANAAVLVDFQVAQPPPLPQDAKQCTVKILERTFGFSFGSPEIVQFTPPTDCGPVGSWAGVSLNFTVTSNGTQFDRLGIFTFQNVESVLHATFFASSALHPPARHADVIIPVTTLANNTGNDASVPPIFSLNVTVPRNAVQVYAELLASGNGNEEFWYFNAPNQFVDNLPTFGDGPFREVRLLVDGQVAGVAFPYAVIFTGGIAPTAWRPITSYGALDIPNYYLDLTPFIPILADGNPHTISLDVSSAESDHAINQNWFVSGNLQVLLDSSSLPTTGTIKTIDVQPFAVTTTTGTIAANGDTVFTVTASRKIRVESEIISGSGKKTRVVWQQTLEYSNTQSYLDNSNIQLLEQTAKGTFQATHNGVQTLFDQFSFPLNVNFTNLTPSGSSFTTTIDHSYDRVSHPAPFILGSTINSHQVANAFFTIASTGNFGNGTSTNTFSYIDLAGNTYDREISSINTNITSDHQGGTLAPKQVAHFPSFSPQEPLSVSKARLPGGRVVGN
ncbi:hypothetical protein NLI96_g19 [Meripilus lineatus]|uniref:Peptide N-acetyl-beta-D-glucosaminyl asparaginase amidase A N-terminal domain-containing protein n=1 Tax=Meripilus lineatus TaxID=2056292 RepID=A0AAD5YIU9_9APHY|nr:hypothetical protein NLI96_g19 [Physisporinus lineatus]